MGTANVAKILESHRYLEVRYFAAACEDEHAQKLQGQHGALPDQEQDRLLDGIVSEAGVGATASAFEALLRATQEGT